MKFSVIPSVRYTNFRKQYPTMGAQCFRSWFSVSRYWSGQIINISVKHHMLSLDFRRNWIADMIRR